MIDCQQLGGDYLNQLRLWAKQNAVPLTANFELTPLCNFSCVMCYVHLTKEEAQKQGRILTSDEWLEIARQAKEAGTLNINLTGGEPFLHPEFWKIYGELNKMGFLISILSNGSLIDEEAMGKFREYGMPYRVKLTVYGASDETYLRTCKSSDGFTRLSKAIDLLKAADVPLTMSSTIVRENADDLQKIYDFAREKGIPIQHTVSVIKSSRGSVNTVEKSRFALDDFSDELTLEALEKSKFPPLDSPFAWCMSYKSSLWVTWHGKLQMCAFLTFPNVPYSGNLKKDYDLLSDALKKLENPAECSDCKWKMFCQRCPGILCGESGHPEKISSGFCNMAKRLYKLYEIKKKEI